VTAGTPAPFFDAEAYERLMGRWSRRLAELFLGFAAVQDGERVLDVGSGTGSLTRVALDRTCRARLAGIDPSASYVEYARSRLADPRVTFAVGDAQALPYEDASFDRTLALLVVMFIPDAPRAAREMRRVTRAGGTVAAATWDGTGGMEMLRAFWEAAVALDASAEPRRDAHRPYSRSGELTVLWQEAGLERVEEEALLIPLEFTAFEDYWSPFLLGQGPPGAYVAGLAPARREALRARLRATLLGDGADGPFTLQARAWAVRGVVPVAPR
jgi:SAM-dependent methyltransferase